jgi:hypothetical protein
MSVLATRAAVAAAAVLFVAAAVMLRHLLTWKLVVTVAAVRTSPLPYPAAAARLLCCSATSASPRP